MMRNDIHSPTSLVTENYKYIASYDFDEKPPMVAYSPCPGVVSFMLDPVAYPLWIAERRRLQRLFQDSPERVHDGAQCDHCGAHFRYAAIMQYKPTGNHILVGEQCLENRFSRATDDFQQMRKQAELDREQQRIKQGVAAFAKENPDLTMLATGDLPDWINWNMFVHDLSLKLRRYGTLSDKQIEAARKALQSGEKKHQDYLRQKQMREDEKAAEKALETPVVEGRGQITGVVVTVKEPAEYAMYPQWHMVVRDDRGFKVYGSIPAALTRQVVNGVEHSLTYESLKGKRVQFVATVEAAGPRELPDGSMAAADPSFGFYSRPSKAVQLESESE